MSAKSDTRVNPQRMTAASFGPGGARPACFQDQGHNIINPALDDDDCTADGATPEPSSTGISPKPSRVEPGLGHRHEFQQRHSKARLALPRE